MKTFQQHVDSLSLSSGQNIEKALYKLSVTKEHQMSQSLIFN